MTVTSVHKDRATRTLTIVSEFEASVDRVWRLWTDPRQLERWWGPPGWSTTVVRHELNPGGEVAYFVTAPRGDRLHGSWRILDVREPWLLEFELASPDLQIVTTRVEIAELAAGGVRMTVVTTFPSPEAMTEFLDVRFDAGLARSLRQIDRVLSADDVDDTPRG
jgi:uncharacterized protein YndB with AHSA1/START domain